MADGPSNRFREALLHLARHDVAFVVVGGVAAVLEGAPIATFDVDIVYDVNEANIERLLMALTALNAKYRDPAGRFIVPTTEKLANYRMNLLLTSLGPLDALQSIGAELRYAELVARSCVHDLDGIEVRAIDLETLIETKAHANRPKDQLALLQLRRLQELRRSAGSVFES